MIKKLDTYIAHCIKHNVHPNEFKESVKSVSYATDDEIMGADKLYERKYFWHRTYLETKWVVGAVAVCFWLKWLVS